ncbi:hypothetical protein V5799_012753 [Amblyomma americanum]|uniref:Uncharacterized protein n=1 Tax=Amblyomma americanum TaxID=6943 RepID=A0AAQ4E826_AMBAM
MRWMEDVLCLRQRQQNESSSFQRTCLSVRVEYGEILGQLPTGGCKEAQHKCRQDIRDISRKQHKGPII